MKNLNENVEIYDGESIVTLTCDDGSTVDLYELAGVEYEGNCYAIVEPVEEMEGVEEGEVFIFKIEELEDGSHRYDDNVPNRRRCRGCLCRDKPFPLRRRQVSWSDREKSGSFRFVYSAHTIRDNGSGRGHQAVWR